MDYIINKYKTIYYIILKQTSIMAIITFLHFLYGDGTSFVR
ncbi:hypothetical protein SAMN05444376_2417 [Bacteroides clarus YIT 12056]|jgi:hypothetical protein|uniref:Uncharacterized protein n=1 Tax=Bacteroides clarus YIT 12056 TaxID=762984 RepID=A0ABN0CRQ4_9BACE|nr:hypothetical protein HMPREF9445_00555 [Bacteroides clarus YIT 12056]SHH08404.1 hypothetical protein SAMN05444376_2417 [Bacteroides clarus YIT 12056]